MVKYYYGNLKDEDISAASGVSESAKYPASNINILNKGLRSVLNDNSLTGVATGDWVLPVIKADAGSGNTISAKSVVLDLKEMDALFNPGTTPSIEAAKIVILGSNDDITYTEVATIIDDSDSITPGGTLYDSTLEGIYSAEFTEVAYRYWELALVITISNPALITWSWSFDIYNLYLGAFIELPSSQLISLGLQHSNIITTSYGGARGGHKAQGQRKSWTLPFNGFSEDDWNNYVAFDNYNGQGLYPCYVKSEIIPITFARVFPSGSSISANQAAYQLYELTNTIEEEL